MSLVKKVICSHAVKCTGRLQELEDRLRRFVIYAGENTDFSFKKIIRLALIFPLFVHLFISFICYFSKYLF